MRFRPCIDIHNGKVKQIVGGSLQDAHDQAVENFVSEKDAAWYASFYKRDDLKGGHIILLNPVSSPFYQDTLQQALQALHAAPGLFHAGGGITPLNAESFLDAGASHVIVTSYVFHEGKVDEERLDEMIRAVGKEHLVLDLSCRKKDGAYYIVTDRWQRFTEVKLDPAALSGLSSCCDEFLIHAADVEGKCSGPDEALVRMLGEWHGIPVTYAGGIRSLEDIRLVGEAGRNHLDLTIGSALDLFGGTLPYRSVLAMMR